MDAFICRKGGTALPKKFFLIEGGTYQNGLTRFDIAVNDPGKFNGSISFSGGNVAFYTGPWYNGASGSKFTTEQMFDFSRYKTLYFDVQYAKVPKEPSTWGAVTDTPAFSWAADDLKTVAFQRDTVRRTYGIDISKINGEHKVAVQVIGEGTNKDNTLYVYNVWLER